MVFSGIRSEASLEAAIAEPRRSEETAPQPGRITAEQTRSIPRGAKKNYVAPVPKCKGQTRRTAIATSRAMCQRAVLRGFRAVELEMCVRSDRPLIGKELYISWFRMVRVDHRDCTSRELSIQLARMIHIRSSHQECLPSPG